MRARDSTPRTPRRHPDRDSLTRRSAPPRQGRPLPPWLIVWFHWAVNSPENPVPRPSARVILISPRDEVLLFRGVNTDQPGSRPFWFAPGGGIEQGETPEQAALRELWEETGLEGLELGPCVWLRSHVWRFQGMWVDSRERYYVARVPEFEVQHTKLDDYEVGFLDVHRWWGLEAMLAAEDRMVPGEFAALLPDLLAGRYPATPITVGI